MPVDPTTHQPGRGEPDISANADPATGYKIRVHGQDKVNAGTSAVAPLYAALAVRLNEALGGSPVGYLNPFLYKNGKAGTAPFFNDITEGDNNVFKAGKGWDVVTGWGSVNGELILQALNGTHTVSLTKSH